MAITLDTTISTSLIFSHNIPILTFSTDEECITFSIYLPDYNYKVIFATELYPVDGKVTAYDIRGIMEDYMRTSNLSFCRFRIDAENGDSTIVCSNDLKILYCTFNPGTTSAAHFAQYNFLTTQRTKVMDINKFYEDELSYFATKGEDISTRITTLYMDEDGQIQTNETTHAATASSDGLLRHYIDFSEVLNGVSGTRLLSVTIRVGARMFTYYFTRTTPHEHFFFHNAFNIAELITLNGKTTKKFTSQRSEAVCGGRSVFYDLRNEMVFEFETVRLSKETAETLMQLFVSPTIYKDGTTQKSVVIKDFSYEIADDDAEKRIVKFTWKYADNRLLIDHKYNTNGKSFTTEFNDIYE